MKLNLPSVQRFGRLDQSSSRVLSSRKSSTGHSWRPGAASFLGAQSSITSSSYVWMPHSLREAVSLTLTLSLLLFMIIGLLLSATLISMQRKSSRFQMFCLHSRKASQTPGLMSSQTARSLLRPGKSSVGGLTHLFRLLSRFSALFRPLISICLCIFSGQMPIWLMSLLAPCPCKVLSYLRKLGPWCRKDLGAPQLILWTSWPSPLTFNPTLQVLLSPSFHLSLFLAPRELIFLHSFPPRLPLLFTNLYVFPPIVLIPEVLWFITCFGFSCTLVVLHFWPRKFWWSLLAPFEVYLLAPKGAKGVVLTSTRVGFSAMWPLPWDLWVFRVIPV